ncbi:MAG: hypothetical protein RIR51_254 [Bacteroidota bacterium]|jgi:DNA-binding XRE family transcriptional regulator
MDLTILGKILKERRSEMGMNQDELSKKSNVAIKSIHSIERGKANPSIKTLNKLIEILGMDLIIIDSKE